jgi:hypothetical protein
MALEELRALSTIEHWGSLSHVQVFSRNAAKRGFGFAHRLAGEKAGIAANIEQALSRTRQQGTKEQLKSTPSYPPAAGTRIPAVTFLGLHYACCSFKIRKCKL